MGGRRRRIGSYLVGVGTVAGRRESTSNERNEPVKVCPCFAGGKGVHGMLLLVNPESTEKRTGCQRIDEKNLQKNLDNKKKMIQELNPSQ